MRLRSRNPTSLAAFFVLVVSLAIFGLQLRTLYTVPVFDSVRWGGDETWLMREFGNQALHGVMSYPESFGGPERTVDVLPRTVDVLPRTDGVLAGSMWVDAAIYGVPGILFFPGHDYVSLGRSVTAILALLLIASLYFVLRKIGVSSLLASMAVLLMVLSQGFVWASHSARYDLLTGLTLIWYCYVLASIKSSSRARMLFVGALNVLIICFSRHLLLLGLPVTLIFLYWERIWKRPAHFVAWLSGAIGMPAILAFVYAMGAHEFSLFGRGGAAGSYDFVIRQIPILRPFSRNVQVSNLLERFHLFEGDIPGMLVIVATCFLLLLAYKIRQRQLRHAGTTLRVASTPSQRFFLACAAGCTLSWLLTEGSRPYYLFHIVPLLLIGCVIVFEFWGEVYIHRWFGEWVAVLVMIGATAIGASHAIPNGVLGEAIARDQEAAIPRLLHEATVGSAHKSRILFDVAGLDRALTDSSSDVLTLDMFQPPPSADELVHKLQANHIDYVVLRSSTVGTPFEPGRALLPRVLDSIGEVRDSALGFFYDDGRNYDASLSALIDQGLDTLRLYRLRHH